MKDGFLNLFLQRRSVRKYEHRPVPGPLLEELLSAAASAPSAHNAQPWHFAVILNKDLKKNLSRAMAKRYAQDMAARKVSRDVIEKKTKKSIDIFSHAPALVIAFLTAERLRPAKGQHAMKERVMGIQSVALACGQLMLAATAAGLASCWFAAPLFCTNEILDTLNLKRPWEPQAIITLGYPAEDPSPKDRRSLRQVRSYYR